MNWNDLPAELRRLVFDAVESSGVNAGGTQRLGRLASVNSEWRDAVEAMTFKTLVVEGTDATTFERLFIDNGRRQAALRHLCVDIRLPRYPQRLNRTCETVEEQDANDSVFTEMLWHYMSALSTWDADALARDYKTPGLVLELVARSPSDRLALFGEEGFSENGESRFFESQLDLHLGSMHEPQGRIGLPEVHAVTGLCVLRQNRRFIAARPILHLMHSLPRLAHVDLEMWHQFSDEAQREVDREMAVQVPFWTDSFKRLTIFRHNDAFNIDETVWGPDTKLPFLAKALCDRSHGLEQLAISNLIDADHFFEPFYHQPRRRLHLPAWDSLRLFAMTSTCICSARDDDEIHKLLHAAAAAARRMPVLQLLELYNAELYEGAAFRYLATGDGAGPPTASIGWIGSWDYPLESDIAKAWEAAAHQSRQRLELRVLPHEQIHEPYRGPIRFIHEHLLTRPALLNPASSQDMLQTGTAFGLDIYGHPVTSANPGGGSGSGSNGSNSGGGGGGGTAGTAGGLHGVDLGLQTKLISRPAPWKSARDREIDAAESKLAFWTAELDRLRTLAPDAEDQDRRDGAYDHVFPWGGAPLQYRASLAPRKTKIEVVYEDGGDGTAGGGGGDGGAGDLGNLPDAGADDDDAWETE